MAKRGTAMVEEPEREYAAAAGRTDGGGRLSRPNTMPRRDYTEDFRGAYDDAAEERRGQGTKPRSSGLKVKFRSRVIPTSLAGRIATGVALLLILAAGIGLLMVARSFLLHDERFMIQSPASIEIEGNKHLTRADLLGIFSEDVERNIFRLSLEDRRAELEALPWVRHATVMRLLPGKIRVVIAERTPAAFVRQGRHIGLVDANGVLLETAAGKTDGGGAGQAEPHYSFPVVTGLSAADGPSIRAARMKTFARFTADLDSSGEKVTEVLSEVDLSNPEDVKALIPDHSAEVLVHFGDDRFLERYRRFQEHLPEWRRQFPNLASVDMRYEREVVLDMGAAKADAAGPDGKAGPMRAAGLPVKAATVKAAVGKVAAVHAATIHPAAIHPAAKSVGSAPVKAAARALPQAALAVPHADASAASAASGHPAGAAAAQGIVPVSLGSSHGAPPAGAPAPKPVTLAAHPAANAAQINAGVSHTATNAPNVVTNAPHAATNAPNTAHTGSGGPQVASQPAASTVSAAARSGYAAKPVSAKPAAGKPLLPTDTYHPAQVAPR